LIEGRHGAAGTVHRTRRHVGPGARNTARAASWWTARSGSVREVLDLVLAVFWRKALRRKEELLNGFALGHVIADEKNAGHGLAGANAVVREVRHRGAVVGQEDSILARRPSQDDGIGRCGQTSVLNAHDIQFRQAA
jgi:hypothetical protein